VPLKNKSHLPQQGLCASNSRYALKQRNQERQEYNTVRVSSSFIKEMQQTELNSPIGTSTKPQMRLSELTVQTEATPLSA
jgi:hypothetical protein